MARELLFFLVWRDVAVRYKQAILGVAWAILKPLMTTLVFAVIFGKIARLPSGETPYPLLVLSGLLPWLYISSTIIECGNSLVGNASLITKVYFPRLIVPTIGVIANLVDFFVGICLLIIMLFWFGFGLGSNILLLPIVLVTLVLLALGAGILAAALNARYRDISFLLPFLVSLGLYLSPIGFASSVIPEKWRQIYSLNPMVGIIDGFRYAVLGDSYVFSPWLLGYAFFISILMIVVGISYFRSVERDIVDFI